MIRLKVGAMVVGYGTVAFAAGAFFAKAGLDLTSAKKWGVLLEAAFHQPWNLVIPFGITVGLGYALSNFDASGQGKRPWGGLLVIVPTVAILAIALYVVFSGEASFTKGDYGPRVTQAAAALDVFFGMTLGVVARNIEFTGWARRREAKLTRARFARGGLH
ncbi:hypothetical protein KDA14_02900 [Candidatus Saccharibacteria bacterium]|nr:hypothetical protein [Candidatus Saccharibacteria bacterium]